MVVRAGPGRSGACSRPRLARPTLEVLSSVRGVERRYLELRALGRLPADGAAPDESSVARFQEVLEAVRAPQSDEEVLVLVNALPTDDSTAFGLAWAIVHKVEASPLWPAWDALGGSGWWVGFLKDRAERGGLVPPP